MSILVTARSFLTALGAGVLILLAGASAEAACTGPIGSAGQLMLDSGVLKYCANNVWRNLNTTNAGIGACGTNGTINYSSPNLVWCYSGNWVHTAPATTYASCTAGQAGYFYYDSGNTYYWFCNASAWRRMEP